MSGESQRGWRSNGRAPVPNRSAAEIERHVVPLRLVAECRRNSVRGTARDNMWLWLRLRGWTELVVLAMKLSEKLEVTALAIKVLPPLIRAMGHHTPVTPTAPGYWTLARQGWRLGLADDVLLSPVDEALSSLLDVWGAQGKVFSASWMPSRPWLPPRIVKCTSGPWQSLLS